MHLYQQLWGWSRVTKALIFSIAAIACVQCFLKWERNGLSKSPLKEPNKKIDYRNIQTT